MSQVSPSTPADCHQLSCMTTFNLPRFLIRFLFRSEKRKCVYVGIHNYIIVKIVFYIGGYSFV